MKQTWSVARREFRGYFDHPTAYILVVAFIALGLFLAFRSLFSSEVASMRSFFSLLPWLFSVFIPAITMRSLAEERHSGTYEWLIAQPVNELHVVAGKFLGNWLFALIALAGSIPASIGILLISDADLGILVAQYVGGAVLAAQLVAIGLFASSTTRNQITAFILGIALSFGLLLIGLPVVLVGLPPAISEIVNELSLVSHFDAIARGVIDFRDLLYFISTAALFAAFSYFALVRNRLSGGRGEFKRLRLGVAALAIGVVLLNLLGSKIHGRIDLTADRLYTLSDGTRQVLDGLDDLVNINLYVSSELPPEIQLTLRDVQDLLADYTRLSNGKLQVTVLHPDEDSDAEEEARSFGVEEIQFNVLRDDELQVRRGWLGLAMLYADQRQIIPVIDRTDDLEYRLTSMLSAITAESKPRLAFLTGYGARAESSFSMLRQVLENRYDVTSVNLETDSTATLTPDSIALAVLAAPQRALSDEAVAKLDGYLDEGGAGLFLVDGTAVDGFSPFARHVETGLDSLFAERGLKVGSGIVYDMQSNQRVSLGQQGAIPVVAPYPMWPVVGPATDHTLTRGLEVLTLGWATPLEVTDSANVQPLWTTSEYGGLRPDGSLVVPDPDFAPDPTDMGPQIVAAAIGGTSNGGQDGNAGASSGRLVVVGDADFLTDNFVQGNPQNVIFVANALDWLAQDESLIAIRSKDRVPPPLVIDSDVEQAALKWGNLLGVPLLFVLAGALRIARRRRLAGRTWGEEVLA